jgi:hypothetical protein
LSVNTSTIVKAAKFTNNPGTLMKPAAAKFLGTFLVALALVAAVVGIVQISRVQLIHRATATVHVLPGIEAGMPVGSEVKSVLQTEADMILSEFILKPVIEKLDFNVTWGKRYNDGQKFKSTESGEILKKSIKVSSLPNSALIQIDVTRDDADESVKIANAIAQSYCDYRVDRRRRINENTASNIAQISREPLEKLTAARMKVEAAQDALGADIRANPPQPPTGESKTVRAAQARYNQAMVQIMSRSNQVASITKSASPDTNVIARVEGELAKAQAELASAEKEVNVELQSLEALKAYWNARQNFESVEKMFAPFKKAAEEARAAAALSDKPPAGIENRAERAATIESHDVSRGVVMFGVAVVLLIPGLGVLMSLRTPPTTEKPRAA